MLFSCQDLFYAFLLQELFEYSISVGVMCCFVFVGLLFVVGVAGISGFYIG